MVALSSDSGCIFQHVNYMKTKARRQANPPVATRRSVSFLGFTKDMNTGSLGLIKNCPVVELKVLVKRSGEVQISGNNLAPI